MDFFQIEDKIDETQVPTTTHGINSIIVAKPQKQRQNPSSSIKENILIHQTKSAQQVA